MRRSRTLSDNAKKLGLKPKNITNNNLERQNYENNFSSQYYNQEQQNPLKFNQFIKNKEDTLVKQDIFNRSINDSLDDHKINKIDSSLDELHDLSRNELRDISIDELRDTSRGELRDGSQDELRDSARDDLFNSDELRNTSRDGIDKSNLQLESNNEDNFPSKVNNEKFITKNQFISKQQFQSNEQPLKNNEPQLRNRIGRSPKEEETVPKQTIINLIRK